MTPDEQTISEILHGRGDGEIIDLLQLYIKKRSVSFLEWAYSKGYRRFMVKGDGECHWQRDQKGDLTTGQVYQLFESESKKA
jgi:hypothetical protein